MTRSRWSAGAAGGVLGLLWPALGHACAVCVAATERNRVAFLATTVLLSLLPLAMIGAGLLWLGRRGRDLLAGEFEERDAYVPGAAGAEPPPTAH